MEISSSFPVLHYKSRYIAGVRPNLSVGLRSKIGFEEKFAILNCLISSANRNRIYLECVWP